MREIKFRGKRIDNGEWVKGYYVFQDDHAYIIPKNSGRGFDSNFRLTFPKWFNVIPETVGEYIGPKDKNGKEIYEGDLVEIDGGGEVLPREVYFKDGCFGIKWPENDCISELKYYCGMKFCSIEIIGNVHENSELLKEA